MKTYMIINKKMKSQINKKINDLTSIDEIDDFVYAGNTISYNTHLYGSENEIQKHTCSEVYDYIQHNYINGLCLTYYEVINGKCKAYIDIDKKLEKYDNEEYTELVNDINHKIKDHAFLLLDGSRELDNGGYKISFHIIFTAYHFDNMAHVEEFVKTLDIDYDRTVYNNRQGKNQKFRMPYCCKDSKNKVPFKLINLNTHEKIEFNNISKQLFSKMCITNIENTEHKKVKIAKPERIKLSKAKNDEWFYKNLTAEQLERLIDYIEPKEECSYTEWRNVIWCIRNIADHYDVDLRHTAHNVSKRLGEYDEYATDQTYDQDTNGEHTIGSMLYWIPADKKKEWKLSIDKEDNFINTDDNIARLFKKYYGENYCYIHVDKEGRDGNFFHFNGMYWELDKGNYNISHIISNDLYFKLDNMITAIMKNVDEKQRTYWHDLRNKLIILQNHSKTKSILEKLKAKLWQDVELDSNPLLMTFKNGVYDFETNTLRNSKRDEWQTDQLTTGYDYEECCEYDLRKFKKDYLDKILINGEDDKDVFLKLLSVCLIGRRIKKFIIANGSGDNGKSNLMELLISMLGSYGMKLNPKEVAVGKKDNFTLNNLHNRRFVYCEEPIEEVKFDGAFIKELTGGDKASFRGLYSKNCDVNIKMILTICCNKKPPISCVDEAMRSRLVDFPFLSTFTDTDVNNETRFELNPYYETDEFRHNNRLYLFHILKSYLIEYLEDKKITLTKTLKKRRDNYLLESDELYQWFNDNYEITKDKTDYITMRQLFKDFKYSAYYSDLNRKDRRGFTKTKFEETILSKKIIKKQFRDRFRLCINGKQVDKLNCLAFVKRKVEEVEIDDDDEIMMDFND